MGFKLDSTGRAGFALALAIGLFFVWRYFPAGFVQGSSSYWLTEVEDVTQYFSGFNAFFNAPFGFPLLAFDSINYPQGTRATFVDAIPLYSLLIKILIPSSFAPFNPFGVWVALAFIGQAVCGWWIIRELQIKSWLALLAMIVCLVTFPALTMRLGHISLMSHWIILCSLALYIRCRRTGEPQRWGWSVLLVAAFYINIYLCVMASCVYVVTCLYNKDRFKPAELVRAVVPFLIIGGSLFLTIFPMARTAVAAESGFGFYSMNLLSPFNGGRYFNFPNPEMPGQYEGFNYLGLGVLLAFALSLVLNRRAAIGCFSKHATLTWLMVLFTVYALSNIIYYGVYHIVTINFPQFMDQITSQFRASGRFFWPVGYCVVIFSIATLYKKLSKFLFLASMFLMISLQVLDLSNIRHLLVDTAKRPATMVMTQAAWDEQATSDIQYLYFYPKFRCGESDVLRTLMPTMRYAAIHNIKINTGYVSRSNSNCSDESTRADIMPSVPAHSLYVFVKGDFPELERVKALFPAGWQPVCKDIDFAHVCRIIQ
ncbi:DUF6311 domain-containing protein [Pseudomonas iridis]|uniref:DUF6311 domain-containing protein n=1 Tax=Pseudomonas iridis TaxID=2710587 RepID=UPI0021BF3BCB|nr:DUF6311 domain-containing protein [Pseudomonas iridis]MCT8948345.1 DUF6311 domain-containing protein [Pseudomonas iridis]